jgi:hypothetical protein
MLVVVGSSLALCEARLAKLQAAAPRVVTTWQRLGDVLLLCCAGAWFYLAWGMGAAVTGEFSHSGVCWRLLCRGSVMPRTSSAGLDLILMAVMTDRRSPPPPRQLQPRCCRWRDAAAAGPGGRGRPAAAARL